MKCLMSVFMLFIMVASAKAQPFLGTSFSFNSAEIQGGYATKNDVEFTVAYKTPFIRTDVASISSLTVGKKLWFSESYSVTPAIGLAHYKIRDFNHPNEAGEATLISSPSPVLRVELGKNYKQGVVFALFNYCRNLSLTVGMKVYFKK